VESGYMVNWSKMRCRQGQATRRNRFKFVTLNIYYFCTFKIFVNTKRKCVKSYRTLQRETNSGQGLSRKIFNG